MSNPPSQPTKPNQPTTPDHKVAYSPSHKGFFNSQFHTSFPDDAVEITNDQYTDLLREQSQGKTIQFDQDTQTVVATEYTPVSAELLRACERKAQALLASTDWTQYRDAAAQILNLGEFDSFRAQVRALRTTPVERPEWPEMPKPKWVKPAPAKGA